MSAWSVVAIWPAGFWKLDPGRREICLGITLLASLGAWAPAGVAGSITPPWLESVSIRYLPEFGDGPSISTTASPLGVEFFVYNFDDPRSDIGSIVER